MAVKLMQLCDIYKIVAQEKNIPSNFNLILGLGKYKRGKVLLGTNFSSINKYLHY